MTRGQLCRVRHRARASGRGLCGKHGCWELEGGPAWGVLCRWPRRGEGMAEHTKVCQGPETWGQQTTFRAASGPQGRYRDPWPASHPVQGPHAVGGWQAWGPVHPSRPVGAGYLSNGRGLPRRLDTKAARCWEARRHTLCCAACRTCSSWVSCSLERSTLTISGTCGHTAMAVRPRGTPVPAAIPRGFWEDHMK